MDGEAFYDQFKSALHFFDIAWGEKDQMEVTFPDDSIMYTHDGVGLMIKLTKGDGNVVDSDKINS